MDSISKSPFFSGLFGEGKLFKGFYTSPFPLSVSELVTEMVSKVRRFSWRMNPRVLAGFKELCRGEDLRLSEAVEDFMRLSLQAGSVSSVLDAAGQGLCSGGAPRPG